MARSTPTKGRMDDAAIFTGALGPAAVAALATGNATPLQIAKTAAGARLVAWWDFEQTTGTSLPDASGNRHEGVLKNFGDRYENRATDAWWVEDRPTNLKHSRRSLWFSGGHMKSHQGDYVEVPSLADLDLSGDFTLSLWVKPETVGVRETMFCVDGVHPIQSGHRVYTGFVAEAFRAMGNGQPVDHGRKLAKPFVADNWEDARQIELGPKYLAGTWKALDENDPTVKPWRNITGTVWASQNPGDKIHFTVPRGGVRTVRLHRPGRRAVDRDDRRGAEGKAGDPLPALEPRPRSLPRSHLQRPGSREGPRRDARNPSGGTEPARHLGPVRRGRHGGRDRQAQVSRQVDPRQPSHDPRPDRGE